MRISRGTTSSPTTSISASSPPRRPAMCASSPADNPAPEASAVSTASKRIATRSSTTRMPNTTSVMRPFTPCSSNALTMIVVDEIATSAPANRLSWRCHPMARPTR
jgi:hypothetical protein